MKTIPKLSYLWLHVTIAFFVEFLWGWPLKALLVLLRCAEVSLADKIAADLFASRKDLTIRWTDLDKKTFGWKDRNLANTHKKEGNELWWVTYQEDSHLSLTHQVLLVFAFWMKLMNSDKQLHPYLDYVTAMLPDESCIF